jgi:lipopolysaccharide/colanic/teichoic acid biosynthesis glycosyltransferase
VTGHRREVGGNILAHAGTDGDAVDGAQHSTCVPIALVLPFRQSDNLFIAHLSRSYQLPGPAEGGVDLTDTYGARRATGGATTASMPAQTVELLTPLIRGGNPVGVFDAHRPAAASSLGKRMLDIVAASILLLIASPIWLLAAVLIRVTSPGPVLFRQERLGVGGRPFTLLKFRTMHDGVTDAAHRRFVTSMIVGSLTSVTSESGAVFKLAADPRVTAIGRFLRSTSLDEIPQLINVLRGEMSLVGPRPPIRYEVDRYEAWQLERLKVRPGITGLWQVSGRNRLTYNEMCHLDIRYIDTWSLGLDLMIVAKTPWAMLVDRGGAS